MTKHIGGVGGKEKNNKTEKKELAENKEGK